MSDQGDAALDGMIANLRGLGKLEARTAELAAPKLEAIAKATASAGTDPTGKPWPLRKADGGRALQNAAQAVHAEPQGDRVDLVLDGPEYWHQTAKEGGALPQRKVIPGVGDPLPDAMKAALDDASAQAFAELTGST